MPQAGAESDRLGETKPFLPIGKTEDYQPSEVYSYMIKKTDTAVFFNIRYQQGLVNYVKAWFIEPVLAQQYANF